MEDRIRQVLLERAEDVPAVLDVPKDLEPRARARIIFMIASTVAAVVLLAAGAAIGLGALLSATPTPAVPDQKTTLPESAESWTRSASPLEGPTTGPSAIGNDGNRIYAITAGDPGLVAVGAENWQGAIWTSSDGTEWNLVEQAADTAAFLDVTTGGPGLVAVALGDRGWGTQRGDEAPIWTSTDGATWTRAPSDAVFKGAWLRAVVVGGPGLVAVGRDLDGPQVWTSSDGLSWTEASVPAMPPDVAFDGPHADAWMQDVATDGARLVAVGSIGKVFNDNEGGGVRYEPVVWTSTDGATWTEVPAGSVFPQEVEFMRSVAASAAGFVAVATTGRDVPWIWTSPDGLTWHRVDPGQTALVSLSSGRGDGSDDLYFEIQAVAAGPDGYVAVGGDAWCVYNRWDCHPSEVAVWTSPDGETWHRVPSAAVFELGRSGRAGGGSVLAGGVVTSWGSRYVVATSYSHPCERCTSGVAVWISEPPRGGGDR